MRAAEISGRMKSAVGGVAGVVGLFLHGAVEAGLARACGRHSAACSKNDSIAIKERHFLYSIIQEKEACRRA
jgi:hypothetical protein